MIGPEITPGMIDQLAIARMIDGLDCGDPRSQLWHVMPYVLDKFRLGIGRTGDQDCPGVGNRLRHPLQEGMILGSVATPDAVCLVMQVPGGMIRMHDELVGIRRTKMKYTRLTMIDPNYGMIVS